MVAPATLQRSAEHDGQSTLLQCSFSQLNLLAKVSRNGGFLHNGGENSLLLFQAMKGSKLWNGVKPLTQLFASIDQKTAASFGRYVVQPWVASRRQAADFNAEL